MGNLQQVKYNTDEGQLFEAYLTNDYLDNATKLPRSYNESHSYLSHFEKRTACQQTVTSSLMLRSNSFNLQ